MDQFDSGHTHSELTDDQVLRQLEAVLQSRHFRQAKSLERFLRYVVTKQLTGEAKDLKEYSIALEVFQRDDNYDTRTNALVRVQASLIRKKLTAYYEEEGAHDEIVIELPKGHYVPEFHYRPTAEPTAVAVAAEIINAPASPPRRARQWGQIAATFIIGLATAFGVQHWWSVSKSAEELNPPAEVTAAPTTGIDPAYLPLWEKFLAPDAANILAYGVPQFFASNGLYFRDVRVNSEKELRPGSQLELIQKTFHPGLTPAEIYTGVGETHGVYLLSRFFWQTEHDLNVTRSRFVRWNEIKDSNLIFLSSMRFSTLAKEMSFPSDFVINSGAEGKVINLRPQPGEEREYVRDSAYGTGLDHAVITLWPGKDPQRRILLLNGNTTWATLAAAEYVTDLKHLRQLNQHLVECQTKAGRTKHAPFFQVLVRVEVKDNQPVAISYITHHDLEISDSTNQLASASRLTELAANRR